MSVAYEFPRLPLIPFALDVLLGRPRPFFRDCQRVLDANPHPRRVEGLEQVPVQGPFVLTMNHYNRRGLRPYHCAMVINTAIAQRRPLDPYVAWVITSELVGQRLGPLPLPVRLTRWAVNRVAAVYGFLLMPPADSPAAARASAVRRALRLARRHPVGVAPEGRGTGVLGPPPRGAGLLLLAMAADGPPVLPVAPWEERETLHVCFGEPYALSAPASLPREDQDRLASQKVMLAIGRLLPQAYWGAYAQELEADTS